MSYLSLISEIYPVLSLFVPGIVVLFVRSKFTTGRMHRHRNILAYYLIISTIYHSLALPLVDLIPVLPGLAHWDVLTWLMYMVFVPTVVGIFLGVDVQKGIIHRLLQKFGLNPVHAIPTAWDWKFVSVTEQWVLVVLKDGSRIAGFCGENSFMSSDPAERDIYIEWVYDIDDDDTWSPRGENGILNRCRRDQYDRILAFQTSGVDR